MKGQVTRSVFTENESQTTDIGELVHTDIARSTTTRSDGHKYFQVLVDIFFIL